MLENLRKTLIYFRKWDSYWKLNNQNESTIIDPGILGRYPLDFKQRITEGHYPHFDEKGIPMWYDEKGGFSYHYTTMFSYALGQSDMFLITGDSKYLNVLKNVADYIRDTVIDLSGRAILRETSKDGSHSGNLSAMTHGEAISVLCRTSLYTNSTNYEETALKLLGPFERKIEDDGIIGEISSLNSNWYEEYVTPPLNHVLNGMIYSLWGLRDLYLLSDNKTAKERFYTGIEYVERALPLFDSGYWSYYWIPESGKNYTASMMYHNLHICQLIALYEQTGKDEFNNYANKFLRYAKSPSSRMKAAKDMFISKSGIN